MPSRVLQLPDTRLRQRPWPTIWVKPGKMVDAIIADMRDVMAEENGLGIAAPQLGIPWSIILVTNTAMLNPDIVQSSKTLVSEWEGCLSVQNGKMLYFVPRHEWVVVEYQDETGKRHKRKFADLYARVVQHEIDHLYGNLIVDRGVGVPVSVEYVTEPTHSISMGVDFGRPEGDKTVQGRISGGRYALGDGKGPEEPHRHEAEPEGADRAEGTNP